ncbi:hypothetical protein JCM8547_001307 [Rhodosporidiobolus lusitaniae]
MPSVPARTLITVDGYTQHSAADSQEHYKVIVLGAGLSGMASAIQLRRKLGLGEGEVMVYEKTDDIGGTWSCNRYPGAACDIPVTFYSFSFAPAYDTPTQWASQATILNYLHNVQRRFHLTNICFRSSALTARFSRSTGLWTLTIKDEITSEMRTRTCNILITCLGGLTIPNDPPFDVEKFDGEVFHSAQWPQRLDLKGKDVVLVGNGCSAIQIVPEVAKVAKSVTQVARSRQTVFPRIDIPSSPLFNFFLKWLPGFGFLLRCLIFFGTEKSFALADLKNEHLRKGKLETITKYIQRKAPKEYWNDLYPDFDVYAKRRVFDTGPPGYYDSLHLPHVSLLADDTVVSASGSTITTAKGKTIKADVVALATGFKVRDYLFPLRVENEEEENLQYRLMGNGVKVYQSTCVSGFPNFFWVMGPNSATGHSSVLFTSEAQLALVFHLIRPLLSSLSSPSSSSPHPAPYVEVTKSAEDAYWNALRKEMKGKVWEKDGGVSWYVDKSTGWCTTLYPWSQIHFWRACTFPDFSAFRWTNASRPAAWRSWFGWLW